MFTVTPQQMAIRVEEFIIKAHSKAITVTYSITMQIMKAVEYSIIMVQ